MPNTVVVTKAMVVYGTKNKRPDVVKTVTEERTGVTPDLVGKTANQAMEELDKQAR